MEPFTTFTAVAVPIDQPNIDTDQIIPARFLGKPRTDRVAAAFHDMRRTPDGALRPELTLNQPAYKDARIIVADRNFACGSSREHAVTVLQDNGFRGFIATSFADIFYNNCFQNGVLPVVLPAERVAELRALLHKTPGATITLDLERQSVTGPDGKVDRFEIDSFRKDCLLKGQDDVSLTLGYEKDIAAFEARQKSEMTWL